MMHLQKHIGLLLKYSLTANTHIVDLSLSWKRRLNPRRHISYMLQQNIASCPTLLVKVFAERRVTFSWTMSEPLLYLWKVHTHFDVKGVHWLTSHSSHVFVYPHLSSCLPRPVNLSQPNRELRCILPPTVRESTTSNASLLVHDHSPHFMPDCM